MQHDERIDIIRLQRMGCKFSVNGSVKCIAVPKGVLGIKSWGRVDFLVNHLGYHVVSDLYTNSIIPMIKEDKKKNYKEIKKAAKTPKLTDKTKKQHKKK